MGKTRDHLKKIGDTKGISSNAEEAEVEWFSEDLQDLLELTPKKDAFSLQGTGMHK